MEKPEGGEIPVITVRNRQELETAIEIIWLSQKYGLKKSIEHKLYRYNLRSYEASDILSDTVMRAIRYLEENKEITNVVGWLRLTSYNIIREKSRQEVKQAKLAGKLFKQNDLQTAIDATKFNSDESAQLATLLTEGLSEPERSIILLMADNLTWKEICIQLSNRGLLQKESATDPKTIERIKKKGNRTAHKLKNLIKEADKLYK